MTSKIEFMNFLEDYIELHTLANGLRNTKNGHLRNVHSILKTIPTKFYLSENDYDTDKLKNSIFTFLEADPKTKGDKEIDYIKTRVWPAYKNYLQKMRVQFEVLID